MLISKIDISSPLVMYASFLIRAGILDKTGQ